MKDDKQPDKATSEVLAEGEHLRGLTASSGWKLAKQKLLDKIVELDSVSGLDLKQDKETLVSELNGRQVVIKMVIDWIADVEGQASQHGHHIQILKGHRKDAYSLYGQASKK